MKKEEVRLIRGTSEEKWVFRNILDVMLVCDGEWRGRGNFTTGFFNAHNCQQVYIEFGGVSDWWSCIHWFLLHRYCL